MITNTKIKVIGVGGAGCNAISRMYNCRIQGVDFIAINTDTQDLKYALAHQKLRIGKDITQGLGSGMNPEIGQKAAEENREEIKEILKDADMVFITCGLGGGTGSGAAPVIAEISKKLGALTIAVVTRPFTFEGKQRKMLADKALENLRGKVDTLLIISNDKVLSFINKDTTLISAFWTCDEVLREAVQGISDLIVLPGIINVDFADVKTITKSSGPALFGIGRAQGDRRVEEAANKAINSPLLDFSIKDAKGILFNVSAAKDLSLDEVNDIANIITKSADSQAKVIFGAVRDKKLKNDEIKITVIATGFETI